MFRINDVGWWMVIDSLLWVGFWSAAAYLLATAVLGARGGRGRPTHEDPGTIAKRRYAAGETTREEFEQLRRDLALDRPQEASTPPIDTNA